MALAASQQEVTMRLRFENGHMMGWEVEIEVDTTPGQTVVARAKGIRSKWERERTIY